MKELADVIMDIRRARDNSILSLKIKGYALDIERLRPYIEYSDYLRFMLNPSEFDYSKVCIDKWEPLIFSEEYKHYFIENKDKLLTDELKKKLEIFR